MRPCFSSTRASFQWAVPWVSVPGLWFVGEVQAEIAFGARQIGVAFQKGYGCGVEWCGIIGNAALGFGESGFKIAPALLVG